MPGEILGVIAYLDAIEVDNLLASIEGGLTDQFVEKFKESKGKKGEGSVGLPSTGTRRKGGFESMKEEAREATKRTTPVSRLSALRSILLNNNYVRPIVSASDDTRQGLLEGELVEVQGSVRVSEFAEFVDLAVEVLSLGKEFPELFGSSVKINSKTEQAIRYLERVSSKGIPVRLTCDPDKDAKQQFDFATVLDPQHLKLPRRNLDGRFNVLGRIRKMLAKNEVLSLYELMPGMSRIPRQQFKSLIKGLSQQRVSGFQISITEEDLRLKYPTILVSAIAMYS